jgi:hypothetical protein
MKKLITLMLIASFSFAEFNQYMNFGSCGKYVGIEDKITKKTYIASFISGVNYALDRTTNTDPEAMYVYVENYCRDNPLEGTVQALAALNKELDKTKE